MVIAGRQFFVVQMAGLSDRRGKEVGVDNRMWVPRSILIVPVSGMNMQSGQKKRRR